MACWIAPDLLGSKSEPAAGTYLALMVCVPFCRSDSVITAWPHLPREVQEKIFAEAKTAWDREHFVSKLPSKLDAIIRRRHA